MVKAIRALGITDDETTCENCGKKNLKCTVALELQDGSIVRYGRDCAGAALYGKKNAKTAQKAETEARTVRLWHKYIAQGKTPAQAADMLSFHHTYTIYTLRGQWMMQTDRGNFPVALPATEGAR